MAWPFGATTCPTSQVDSEGRILQRVANPAHVTVNMLRLALTFLQLSWDAIPIEGSRLGDSRVLDR